MGLQLFMAWTARNPVSERCLGHAGTDLANQARLIIETGIAHGGSLIFSASMLAQLDMCDAIEADEMLDPKVSRRKVLGIDIDIRAHNRAAIEAHPMASRIQMI